MDNRQPAEKLDFKGSEFYSRLYTSLYSKLIKSGSKVCANQEMVEDTVQELFEYFLSDTSRMDNVDNLEAYLKSSLRRRLFKKISQQRLRISPDSLTSPFVVASPENDLILEESSRLRVKQIQQAISQLSEGESMAIKSRFFDEMSYEQIAQINCSTKRTVYNQVHNAIKKLKKLL